MTNQPFRIGILGLIHDHVWDHLPQLQHSQNAELVAAFDTNQGLRDRIGNEYHCPTYTTPDELFSQHELDGVYIFSSNKEGAALALAAIQRGIPVMIEKADGRQPLTGRSNVDCCPGKESLSDDKLAICLVATNAARHYDGQSRGHW